MNLTTLFKSYCEANIRSRSTGLSTKEKNEIVNALQASPFLSVIQAYSVLDLYDYKHLTAYGFDTYFGYPNDAITAETILEIVHPEDQEAFGQLYYLCLEGLVHMKIPTKDIGHFCISYRIKDAQGNYHKVIETNNIIACDSKTHVPLVNLAQITVPTTPSKTNLVSYYFNIKDEQDSVAIMEGFLEQFDSKINVFTENEIKISKLIKQGFTSQQIADTLFLSKHTIDKYRKHLLQKTECRNAPQLIQYLEGLGLV